LICGESGTSFVMQFVEFPQISNRRDLQEIEIVLAGITEIGDVTIKGGIPVVVLADAAMEQQVVPPGERTCAFYGLRTHGHLPKAEKDGRALSFREFSDVMLFHCCCVAKASVKCSESCTLFHIVFRISSRST